MQAWFASNPTLSCFPLNDYEHRPRARLLCFPGAGSDASIFTSKGTPRRPMANPLLAYCLSNDIQLLGVQYPGRTARIHEPMMSSVVAVAEAVLDLLQPILSPPKSPSGNRFELLPDVPLIVAGHSMGTFIAYEFLCLMRLRDLPPAMHVLLSCMLSPDTPRDRRPWKSAETLDSDELQEECRGWGINSEVFLPDMWKLYEPILRKDFALLDSYTFCEAEKKNVASCIRPYATAASTPTSSQASTPSSSPKPPRGCVHAPLGISTTVFYAEHDQRVTLDHVIKWKTIMLGSPLFSNSPSGFGTMSNSGAKFQVKEIPGGHNFFYDAAARAIWMETVNQVLDRVLIDLEYS